MFRFEHPQYLWLLLAIPLLIVLCFIAWRKHRRSTRKLGDKQLVGQLVNGKSYTREIVKYALLTIVIGLIALIISRPQMGLKSNKVERSAIEAIVAIDISNSMLAKDVSPSRLEKSKLLVENIASHLVNDKIGIIVYAGQAFIQMPLTADFISAKMFTDAINPSMIASQGTDIAAAINLAINSFTEKGKAGKAIILITDGEDHEGEAINAAREAAKKGIQLFVLGIGTEKGAPIESENGQYMTDQRGETVITRLNIDMCKQLAEAGKGKFIYVDNTSKAWQQLEDEIRKMQKGDTETIIYDEYDEQFQAFGIIAILLLIIEMFVLNRSKVNLFTRKQKKQALTLLLFVISCATSYAQSDRDYIRKGNSTYRKGAYDKAEIAYRKALDKNPHNPQALYNMGCAIMRRETNNSDSAVVWFNEAARYENDKKRRALSYHNIGVIAQANKDYDTAIEAYKEALRNNPQDDETRFNLIHCLNQKKKNQNNQNKQNNQQNKNTDKNKNDKKDNNNQQNQQKNNDQKQNKEKPEQQKMSRENAEQMLNAAKREEQKTQQRLQKATQQAPKRSLKHNW